MLYVVGQTARQLIFHSTVLEVMLENQSPLREISGALLMQKKSYNSSHDLFYIKL
jgi:hypothetical protein